MPPGYPFLNKEYYEPVLENLGVPEAAYLSAIQQLVTLFPRDRSLPYYESLFQSGDLDQFNLVPTVNERLRYHPLPILLNAPMTYHALAQLVYVGLALVDFERGIGRTKAFTDLTREDHYRG